MVPAGLPYWRLSAFYFFYFAVVGTIVPFWGLYLQSLDFSALEIGYIGSILMATKIIAPNVWGWIADVSGRRLSVIRLGCFLSFVFFLIILIDQTFWWMAACVALYSFFWNAVLAQYEVVTLAYLDSTPHFYSRIRLWGSLGFIVVVMLLGAVFDWLSIRYLPAAMLLFLFLIWVSSLSIQDREFTVGHGEAKSLWKTVSDTPVLSFLFCAFLLQVSHGSYYTFYSVYLEALDYSRTEIGFLWALGVIAEVLVFLMMHRLMHHFSLRNILLVSLFLTVIRWWLIGCYAEHVSILWVAQGLHAFSFGCAHAVAIEFVRRHFHGNIQGQGQALYSAVSFGAGGAVGAVLSGLVWSSSPILSFALSAFFAAAALVVVWFGVRGEEFEQRSV